MSTPTLTAEELVQALKVLRPDLVVLPRKASHIMALRGHQYGPIFYPPPAAPDFVSDWIDLSDPDLAKDVPEDLDHDFDVRMSFLVAKIYEGMVEAFEVWENRKEPDSKMYEGWASPLLKESE